MLRKFSHILCFFALSVANIHSAPISLTSQAQLIAGMDIVSSENNLYTIQSNSQWIAGKTGFSAKYFWDLETFNDQQNQLNPLMTTSQEISSFLKKNLGEAYHNTHHLVYFFGGIDFSYPNLFFPELETLVMIGTEPCGIFPDINQPIQNESLTQLMFNIGSFFSGLPFRTYSVTTTMRDPAFPGVTALLATAIALENYEITAYTPIFLSDSGIIHEHALVNSTPGIHLTYKKHPLDIERHVFYFQHDLLQESTAGIQLFLKQIGIDTSFYKASSFVTHSVSNLNQWVLQLVDYVVQEDTGIPLADFNSTEWDIHLFGIYTRPYYSTQSIPVYWGLQQDLLHAYSSSIEQSGCELAMHLIQEIWPPDILHSHDIQDTALPCSISWDGFLPFQFGYGGQLADPKIKKLASTLQYCVKKTH